MNTVIQYAFFCIISIVANIASQDLSIRIYSGAFAIPLSIFIGTLTGLAIKYMLDKHYIFKFNTTSQKHNAHTFILYSSMGIITTLVFWGFEYSFEMIFQSKTMRYLGGVLGLIIGYIIKYNLDKKFVFNEKQTLSP